MPAAMPSMCAFISSTARRGRRTPRGRPRRRASRSRSARSRPRRRVTARWVSAWISSISSAMCAGGALRLLGELADLVGDDREAAALLAGAGGLDGGVEREQVGLLGDAGDRRDDAGDLAPSARRACGSCRSPPARSRARTAWPRRPRGRPERRAGRPRAPRARSRRVSCASWAADPVVAAMLSASCLEDSTRRAWRSAPAVASPIAPAISPTARPASSEALAISREASETELGGARDLVDHRGERAARGVVGLDRRREPLADLVDGLGDLAELVARRHDDRLGPGLDLVGEVADRHRLEAAGEVGAVVLAERAQAGEDRPDGRLQAGGDDVADAGGDERGEREQDQLQAAGSSCARRRCARWRPWRRRASRRTRPLTAFSVAAYELSCAASQASSASSILPACARASTCSRSSENFA